MVPQSDVQSGDLTPFERRVQELLRAYGLDLNDVDTLLENAREDEPELAEDFVRRFVEEYDLVRLDETFWPTIPVRSSSLGGGLAESRDS